MASAFENALKKLPAPTAAYAGAGARFELYRAKDLHGHWNGTALKRITMASRKAYARYGKRPLLDAYDKKAAIYLVRAVYRANVQGAVSEEWLSVRMVPGDRSPQGVSEPEIYELAGKSVDHWMKKKINVRDFWGHVASSSRMCGIHPYLRKKNGAVAPLADPRHRYTAICFALIHKQFVIDHPLSRFPYAYITAMIRPDFYKERLAYRANGRTVRPVHGTAHAFLGVPRADIRVRRATYSYAFPLYWLHNQKLLRLVNTLRAKVRKTPLQKLEPKMLAGLAATGRRPLTIAGLRIEPAKMRRLVDRFVPDVPELKITEAARWYRGMDAVLRAAHVVPAR